MKMVVYDGISRAVDALFPLAYHLMSNIIRSMFPPPSRSLYCGSRRVISLRGGTAVLVTPLRRRHKRTALMGERA